MANSIPASQLVSVQPGVIGTGGSPLSLNAVFLTQNTTVPIGAMLPFPTALAVSNYFGVGSTEANLANVYFLGFDGSNIKPGNLFFYQYNTAPVAAYLLGARQASLTLAQLQAVIPGVVTGSIATTVLTVTAVTSGALVAGQVLTGTGVTAGTRIVNQLTGTTGGIGTYTVSASQTVASTAITGAYDLQVTVDGVVKSFATVNLSAATSFSNAATLLTTALSATVTYNSQLQAFQITSGTTGATSTITFATGAMSTVLALTLALGAVTSQGAIAATPAGAMNVVANVSQNWVSFMTTWEPNITDKTAFAVWTNAQNQRYAYVAWDTDITATQANNTTCFGQVVTAGNYNGIIPVWSDINIAAFICGMTASIDFTQRNGRITYAYKGQSGLTATVTDVTTATNLTSNGYNFYGAYATANQNFTFLQTGSTPGIWKWIDAYINQVYLNSQFQLALMTLLSATKSLPYNNLGYGMMAAACQDPINQGLNFGSIRNGIPLSAQQAASVNAAAGLPIDGALTNFGYYLQILPASAQVRGLRQSPPCTFWYTDGGSVQKINLASLDVM